MTVQLLSKVLHNPFYVGEVVYQGVHYAGSHEPLVDRATYESVQTLLATRVNGERTVKHAHYLKSTIYCGICGSRLIVTNVKPRGVVYEYFVCLGRHSKKQPQCLFRATLAEQIEDDTPVVIAVPAWLREDGHYSRLSIIDEITDMGYNLAKFQGLSQSDMIYYREGQIVAREIIVLRKSKAKNVTC